MYRVGPLADRIALDFALEAKCYAPENGVGVKELSRPISHFRHRQFGILVATPLDTRHTRSFAATNTR